MSFATSCYHSKNQNDVYGQPDLIYIAILLIIQMLSQNVTLNMLKKITSSTPYAGTFILPER